MVEESFTISFVKLPVSPAAVLQGDQVVPLSTECDKHLGPTVYLQERTSTVKAAGFMHGGCDVT
jgi:hypothetical protein